MRSTFMGLEASKKGLFVQQSALYTTGHNIANTNTEGYSRQRVNMQPTAGYPHAGLNTPTYPGYLGTGVEASSVQRIRDEFIDRQYRQETNKLGYWESTLNSINQMEDILSEPSEFGINQAFTEFWESFQDLSVQPTDSAARKVAVARAESLAEAFNYNYTQLETIQGNLGNEIAVSTKQINTILEKIAAINDQVKALEPNGFVTNDLYDARDLLVDELNEYIPVSIERVPSGGLASEVAEGSLKIIYQGVTLVDGRYHGNVAVNGATGQINGAIEADGQYDLFTNFSVTGVDVNGQLTGPTNFNYGQIESAHPSRGKLVALIDAYGHADQDRNGSNGIYPDMLAQLNKVAETFVNVFNQAHKAGYTLTNGANPSQQGGDFFKLLAPTPPATAIPVAKAITVEQTIIDDPSLIAASTRPDEEGNGRWALELSNMQFTNISGSFTFGAGLVPSALNAPNTDGITINIPNGGTGLDGFTFQSYYTGMIGDLAVLGDQAITNQFNAETQMITISNARSSMNSVSLDEEMTNMITFQQAYNANARMITVVDETLDKIINGMGRVGL